MKTIPSFQIDHNILKKGIYISRIDDDITTYDIRMRKPNREPVMTLFISDLWAAEQDFIFLREA